MSGSMMVPRGSRGRPDGSGGDGASAYSIVYSLGLPDGGTIDCEVRIDERTLLSGLPPGPPPEWARLEFGRCEGCSCEETHCPVALRLAGPIRRFATLVSHERVTATVTTPERTTVKTTDAQDALRSLFGLIMATSGCPAMRPFRYMARFHLPFSSFQDTVSRITASCLMARMFRQEEEPSPSSAIEEVGRLYDVMVAINAGIAERLRSATEADGPVNAIVIFSAMSSLIPAVIGEELDRLRALFDDRDLADQEPEAVAA